MTTLTCDAISTSWNHHITVHNHNITITIIITLPSWSSSPSPPWRNLTELCLIKTFKRDQLFTSSCACEVGCKFSWQRHWQDHHSAWKWSLLTSSTRQAEDPNQRRHSPWSAMSDFCGRTIGGWCVELRLIASKRSQLFTSFSNEEHVLFASLFTLIS